MTMVLMTMIVAHRHVMVMITAITFLQYVIRTLMSPGVRAPTGLPAARPPPGQSAGRSAVRAAIGGLDQAPQVIIRPRALTAHRREPLMHSK
jgi:hypothetical protein